MLLSKATPQAHVSVVLPVLGAAEPPPRKPLSQVHPTRASSADECNSEAGHRAQPPMQQRACPISNLLTPIPLLQGPATRTSASRKFSVRTARRRSAQNALHTLHSIHQSLCEALLSRQGLYDVEPPELCAAPESEGWARTTLERPRSRVERRRCSAAPPPSGSADGFRRGEAGEGAGEQYACGACQRGSEPETRNAQAAAITCVELTWFARAAAEPRHQWMRYT